MRGRRGIWYNVYMKQRTKNISIILAVLIVAAIGVAVKIYKPQQVVAPGGEQTAAIEKPYTNAKGEKWGPLPEGPWAFQVTSAAEEVGPRFLEGEINPVKVAPGSTQKMRVVVQSPSGIASVIAHIETDNGTTTVPLIKTGVITYRDMMPEKYVVEDGALKVLSPVQMQTRWIANVLAEGGFLSESVARAAGGDKEVWEGSWVVRDTHEREYQTVFVARDNAGRENTLTLAWSDPCGTELDFGGTKFPTAGTAWSPPYTCTIDTLTGVENNNATIPANIDMTLNAAFVWNPGYSITIASGVPGGKIIIGAGGFLNQTELVWMDPDGDGWVASGNRFADNNKPACSSPCVYRRQDALSGSPAVSYDCYDSSGGAGSANTHPNQYDYFTTANGLGSFDYDCDGSQTQQYTSNNGQCDICDSPICGPLPSAAAGWVTGGAVPGCGVNPSFDYVVNPGYCDINCIISPSCDSQDIAQGCR